MRTLPAAVIEGWGGLSDEERAARLRDEACLIDRDRADHAETMQRVQRHDAESAQRRAMWLGMLRHAEGADRAEVIRQYLLASAADAHARDEMVAAGWASVGALAPARDCGPWAGMAPDAIAAEFARLALIGRPDEWRDPVHVRPAVLRRLRELGAGLSSERAALEAYVIDGTWSPAVAAIADQQWPWVAWEERA